MSKIDYNNRIAVAAKVNDHRNEEGDIFFESTDDLLKIFSLEEVCLLAIRGMRNSEASKESNKKREAANRELLRRQKSLAKAIFNKKPDELNDEEFTHVIEAMAKA